MDQILFPVESSLKKLSENEIVLKKINSVFQSANHNEAATTNLSI